MGSGLSNTIRTVEVIKLLLKRQATVLPTPVGASRVVLGPKFPRIPPLTSEKTPKKYQYTGFCRFQSLTGSYMLISKFVVEYEI